jgi:hypothetical protein
MDELTINQAAARMITMGASGNTGLPHTQALSLSLSLTYIQSHSSICYVWCIKKNKLYKDNKKIRKVKKYC